jgi:2-C-methyl-D-erythritol 4-phosphate cytidylyltransferase
MEKFTAIVLSAGKGSRMNSDVHKQYLNLADRPVIVYALDAFEKSSVDEIVLVAGSGEEDYCRTQIVEKYELKKVKAIVCGGKERYHSVYNGLKAAGNTDYVMIHDGARPFLTDAIISRMMDAVRLKHACVAGMHVKDTIKITNESDVVQMTPDRKNVWMVQTPQAFSYPLICDAYEKMMLQEDTNVTDDAMVVEKMCNIPVSLVEGSYTNIKITTPEDMMIAEAILKQNYLDIV